MNYGEKRKLPLAALVSDSLVLLHLLKGQPLSASSSQQERLERFYGPQASHYDNFRERLLHGRRELVERLAPLPGSRVIELGAGTGRNVEFFGARLLSLERLELVDLCPSLLHHARDRCSRWPEIAHAVQADVTTYTPEAPADYVFFSYSLTMIPEWRRALANAIRMLRPGGLLGVVDFHASRNLAHADAFRQGRLSQWFWRNWFGHDGVHPTSEHLEALCACTTQIHLQERYGKVPYLPFLRAPYYLYIGRKTG
jgi:S-adenosylmethionine-diacylgycerolhomoserine-N-methlytransferase